MFRHQNYLFKFRKIMWFGFKSDVTSGYARDTERDIALFAPFCSVKFHLMFKWDKNPRLLGESLVIV